MVSDWNHNCLCLEINTERPVLTVCPSPAAPPDAENQSLSNPSPAPAGGVDAISTSAAASVSVPTAAIAPMVFVSSDSSDHTVLVVGANQVVAQPPTPSPAISETAEATPLITKPAASPGSTAQEVPSPESSIVKAVDSAKVKKKTLFVFRNFKPSRAYFQMILSVMIQISWYTIYFFILKTRSLCFAPHQNSVDEAPPGRTRRNRRATSKSLAGRISWILTESPSILQIKSDLITRDKRVSSICSFC